jgi:hypothetical protein
MPQEPSDDFHDLEWVVECSYDGPDHVFPSDWTFGGADGDDPRADPRWLPTTYRYFSEQLDLICTTQTPLCDDQAVDEFTKVATYSNPKFVSAQRPGEDKPTMLPWEYTKADDIVREVQRASTV